MSTSHYPTWISMVISLNRTTIKKQWMRSPPRCLADRIVSGSINAIADESSGAVRVSGTLALNNTGNEPCDAAHRYIFRANPVSQQARRRVPRGAKRRAEIVSVAERVFLKRGFADLALVPPAPSAAQPAHRSRQCAAAPASSV
jgi:hypothetical protein